MKTNTIKTLFFILAIFIFCACDKENEQTLSSEKQLLTFQLLKKDNPTLSKDVAGTITSDNKIKLVFQKNTEIGTLIATFTYTGDEVVVGSVTQESGTTVNDFSKSVTYTVIAEDGSTVSYKTETSVSTTETIANVPKIYITTDDASLKEIPSKDYYVTGTVRIDGNGTYEDFKATAQIKGRGNSTWGYTKKPYRIKLDEKASICGFTAAKNYVLLANYLDPTLMLNAVAFKIGKLLGIPYTNTVVPADVYLNGTYKGSYMITEQIEVKSGRVNMDKSNSVIWELDSYYDEEPKFKTTKFNLPVMLKDPDMDDEQFAKWKADFESFTTQFAKEPLATNTYTDLIDINSVVKYIITYNLTHNMEINHPKSVFIHKEGNGMYVMGPIWDFDWAFGYEGTYNHFSVYDKSLWKASMGGGIGYNFFHRFMEDPRVIAIYKTKWKEFRESKFDELMNFVDSYYKMIKPSATNDAKLGYKTKNFETKVNELKTWLKNRASYMDTEANNL
jgi:hypothetical protein